ncbi:glutathione S-transferase family protein [Tateyamaria omphalii]|uniref:glutathione S-transferase family protein n=1 Tax=Tateyamaria omphalii TaxID=299262 RepID=UPI001C9949D8|nr:glutathione S-transferase family protein [Tateyamaria omphalii]MBY5933077.1 glutathione S-transferase family protein [Tateyamaria omphalii]
MAYVLHYAPDNASLIVRMTLEEMGVDYTTALVDRAARAQSGAAYRNINPAGLIPALETPHGVMFETAAILLWLSDTHGQMAPRQDNPERARFLSMLFFVSNTLHAQLRMLFYPEKYVGDDAQAQRAMRDRLISNSETAMTLPRALGLVDAYIGAQSDLDAPSILECYMAAIVRWCALYPAGLTAWFDLSAYPALATIAARLDTRSTTRAVAEAEGLGHTPFSRPVLPNPPEGTAL